MAFGRIYNTIISELRLLGCGVLDIFFLMETGDQPAVGVWYHILSKKYGSML
jgi:hypothetical protein